MPAAFLPPHPDDVAQLMRQFPLATLIATIDGAFEATPVPLLHVLAAEGHGTLIGHVSKANPLTHSQDGTSTIAIFNGPQHYISPNWYESKREHGRVVPTWNYTTVHVHGSLSLHTEPEWILGVVTALTNEMEATEPEPWQVTDAPAEYIEGLLHAIVGVEVIITRMDAKWKVSQNRPEKDQLSTQRALDALGQPAAREMAELIGATRR